MRRGVQHARHQYPTSLHLESANLRFFLSLYWLFSIPLFLKCFAVATQYHCNSAIAEKTAHVPTSARYTTGLTENILMALLESCIIKCTISSRSFTETGSRVLFRPIAHLHRSLENPAPILWYHYHYRCRDLWIWCVLSL